MSGNAENQEKTEGELKQEWQQERAVKEARQNSERLKGIAQMKAGRQGKAVKADAFDLSNQPIGEIIAKTNFLRLPLLDQYVELYVWRGMLGKALRDERPEKYPNMLEYKESVHKIKGNLSEIGELLACDDIARYYDENKIAFDEGVLEEHIANKLYALLVNKGFISDESFDNKWQWIKQRNQLSYLAKGLKQKRLLSDSCHQDLAFYILDPKPKTSRPLKNLEHPAEKRKQEVDEVINTVAPNATVPPI